MVALAFCVGNYPQLYVQYKGEPTYFYHLPKFADPRLGQTTHTLFWFDTYRDQGMYEHPDFHFQRAGLRDDDVGASGPGAEQRRKMAVGAKQVERRPNHL